MRWSKLEQLVEARFATSVAGRVAIFSTRYGECTCGRAWVTVDGEEVANFCMRAAFNFELGRTAGRELPAGYGELSRQDAYKACWAYLHDLSIDQAIEDSDPLVQSLAVLDARLGRRRLGSLPVHALHPLAQRMLALRREAESRTAG